MVSARPNHIEEADWIRRCQRGEREPFAALIERYQRRIFALVYYLVRRRDEIEDLVQEIFVKAYVSIRSYNFQSSFATWLSRIAVNHCYDFLRRQRASRVSYYWQMNEDSGRALEARAESSQAAAQPDTEQRTALRDLVGKLLGRAPAKDQILLVLKEVEGFSVEEIAEVLNLKPTTVKVRLHRARKRMLEDLKQWQQGR